MVLLLEDASLGLIRVGSPLLKTKYVRHIDLNICQRSLIY